jgi:hypothetical protein
MWNSVQFRAFDKLLHLWYIPNWLFQPAGKRSQLMLNNMHDENPDPYGQKKHEMKSAELSGNNIFHGDETPQHHQRSVQKVREMSGSDIFSNDQPKARNTVGGIRKPPGGGSTIMLA